MEKSAIKVERNNALTCMFVGALYGIRTRDLRLESILEAIIASSILVHFIACELWFYSFFIPARFCSI
ncbi:MAG: hypothetical protein JJE36_05665 [Coriobacteriia bacterium]|nr:hypothetical protein [Coriobacteriia bacterium]